MTSVVARSRSAGSTADASRDASRSNAASTANSFCKCQCPRRMGIAGDGSPRTQSRVSYPSRCACERMLAAKTMASSSKSRAARPAGSTRSASVARRKSSATRMRGGASMERSITASVPADALRRQAMCRNPSPGRYSRIPKKSLPGPERVLVDGPATVPEASDTSTPARSRSTRGSTKHSLASSNRTLFITRPNGNTVSIRNRSKRIGPRRPGQYAVSAITCSPGPTCCTKAREPGSLVISRTNSANNGHKDDSLMTV